MSDKEKVVNGLRCCSEMSGEHCRKCPYQDECRDGYGIPHLANDALELLDALENRCNTFETLEQRCKALEKQNEPMKAKNPVYNEQKYGDHLEHCPSCEKALPRISQYGKSNYCYYCGQAVKWE